MLYLDLHKSNFGIHYVAGICQYVRRYVGEVWKLLCNLPTTMLWKCLLAHDADKIHERRMNAENAFKVIEDKPFESDTVIYKREE